MSNIVTITRLPETLQGVQIEGPDDMYTAFHFASGVGYTGEVQCIGPNSYRLRLNNFSQGDQFAYVGDWAALEGTSTVKLLTNAAFAADYTTNIPVVWDAVTHAPTATATPGGTATISFPRPSSANAPFTYTVTNGGSAVTLSGSPVVAEDGTVTLTVTGLTAASTYAFVVKVSTQYQGVTATSVASNSITAQ